MTTKQEEVAKALWAWIRWGVPKCEHLDWAQINPRSLAHEITMDAARAAIAAMREPTSEMNGAGLLVILDKGKRAVDDAYRAMIDAAYPQ